MARGINRLPASFKSLKPGMYCDGGNLYLQVSLGAEGNRRQSWIFRYRLKGQKPREMGLGSVNDVTLVEARKKQPDIATLPRTALIRSSTAIDSCSKPCNACQDSDLRRGRRHLHPATPAAWKNPTHAVQWASTLRSYASPVLARCLSLRSTHRMS